MPRIQHPRSIFNFKLIIKRKYSVNTYQYSLVFVVQARPRAVGFVERYVFRQTLRHEDVPALRLYRIFTIKQLITMNTEISDIANKSLKNTPIDRKDAAFLLTIEGEEVYDLLYWANKIRFKFFGDKISLCAILSAKQGSCSEDCKFCTQSGFYETTISTFKLVGSDHVAKTAERSDKMGADSLGLVTSGYSLNSLPKKTALKDDNNAAGNEFDNEFDTFCNLVKETAKTSKIPLHASIGCMTEDMAFRLAESGIKQINHNMETSRNHFKDICTTHSYDDRLATIKNAKKAGLKVCSGGIFGIGENADDRLELAFTLRELEVDTVPLNFLNPIEGTPLSNAVALKPMEILKTIAFFRFVLPDKEIKLAGGRETNLRDLQSWMFYAGASSTMIGDYLTTAGRPANEDIQMIEDLELTCKTKLPKSI
ncbi:MAG: biotin synthase BioB [Candidatus Anammoxibacter sp.]